MAKRIKYIGELDRYFELPITGKMSAWGRGDTDTRENAEADLLIATGKFSIENVGDVVASYDSYGNIIGLVNHDGSVAGLGGASQSALDVINGRLDVLESSTASVQTLPFSTTLTLNGNTRFEQYQINSQLNFVISGIPSIGSRHIMRLMADGTNVPTFTSDVREVRGSSGWDNTANVVNIVELFYDGYEYLYCITQRRNDIGVLDNTVPTISSATVQNATPNKVVVVFSEAVNQTIAQNIADWSVSGKTVSSVALTSSTSIELTLSAPLTFTDVVTVTYTNNANRIKDLNANNMSTSSPVAVTNNINNPNPTAPSQITTFTLGATGTNQQVLNCVAPNNGGSPIINYVWQYSTDNTNWTTFADGTSTSTTVTITGLSPATLYYYRVAAENSVGVGQYSSSINATTSAPYVNFNGLSLTTETANGSGFNYAISAVNGYANQSISSLVGNGTYTVKSTSTVASSGSIPVMALCSTNTAVAYTDSVVLFGLYAVFSGTSKYLIIESGVGALNPNVAARNYAVNDLMRIARVGSALSAQVSSDNGVIWTTIHNFTNANSSTLYPWLGSARASANFELPSWI